MNQFLNNSKSAVRRSDRPIVPNLMEANQVRKLLPIIVSASLAIFSFSAHAQDAAEDTAPSGIGSVGVGLEETATDTGIRGNIKDVSKGGTDTDVKGAIITYVGSEEGNEGQVTSDKDGKFEIKPLKAGEYSLSVVAEGYRDRDSLPYSVIAGQMTIIEVKMREKTTLLVFASRFGWVGIPLLLCSIAAVTFIIERIFTYVKLNSGTEALLHRVDEALEHDNMNEAQQACDEVGTPIANVLKSGLTRYSAGLVRNEPPTKSEIQEMMQEGAARELPEFENNLTWLSMIAVVSPLFGLLGTVLGMIRAFTVIALEGTNDPNQLADGISVALYTTAAGLSIAAPALVFYAIFENIVNKNTLRIEDAASNLANRLVESDAAAS